MEQYEFWSLRIASRESLDVEELGDWLGWEKQIIYKHVLN
jgi:hypothetical protein